ncbi:MAG: radical SAM protein, partial [Acetobacteraceae bacterium]|nr:radical SAM protein [Acetobacteraceae bacterium]
MDKIEATIGLLVTLRCPITCRHCMFECGPHRTEVIDWGLAHRVIEDSARYRLYERVVATGGEPFLYPGELAALARSARENGVGFRVVTSAFWATSKKVAKERLKALGRETQVAVSADAYHQEYVPQ